MRWLIEDEGEGEETVEEGLEELEVEVHELQTFEPQEMVQIDLDDEGEVLMLELEEQDDQE